MSFRQATAEDVLRLNPRASKSVIEANSAAVVSPESNTPEVRSHKLHKRREPNATEREFGLILEAMKRRGEIVHYAFEGLSVRWGDGMRYTCDWAVFAENKLTSLIEIKGRQNSRFSRRADAIVRFKGAAAEWKAFFTFEMHEKTAQGWHRIF